MSILSRRNALRVLLGGSALTIAGSALGVLGCEFSSRKTATNTLFLDRLFVGKSPAYDRVTIGRRVRASYGFDSDLIAEVIGYPPLRSCLLITCDATRTVALKEKFRDDFIAGDIVQTDGWILSQSETLIAGLMAVATDN